MPPAKKASPAEPKLTVAVTGPTGEIGKAFIRALERSPKVGRVIGMARRPFDAKAEGWRKTEYRRGDILDRASVEGLVDGADVVVHLAFIIFGDPDEARKINLEGSRNVFEATIAAKAKRLVYASSVAAYGFDEGRKMPLSEESLPTGPTASTTPPRRPSSRGCSPTCSPTRRPRPTSSAPASWPAPTPCCCSTTSPTSRSARRCRTSSGIYSTSCRSSSPCSPTRASRSSSSTTTTSPRPCAPRSSAGASPASTTSPAPASSQCPTWPTRSATTRSRSPSSRSTQPRRSSPACPSPRPRRAGSTPSAPRS